MENAPSAGIPGGEGGQPQPTAVAAPSTSKADGNDGHRRSLSGSLLGGFPFLKSARQSEQLADYRGEGEGEGAESPKRGSSLATALRQTPGRKRKGSLRKAAMLGTGKLMRERRNSVRAAIKSATPATDMEHQEPDADVDEERTPRRFQYEAPSLNSSSESGWSPPDTSASSASHDSPSIPKQLPQQIVAPQLANAVSQYASTTDDDEGLSFYRPTASSSGSSYSVIQLQPSPASLQRRRPNRPAPQSTLTIVQTPADMEIEEWDYSETEWWGWVILICTWLVFVVGMGSCLGVWSWAWDVGETPYAPPELEDDPTLPITGYYPALLVCTAVMAWVWVVVAWVGMKYFRHAKEG